MVTGGILLERAAISKVQQVYSRRIFHKTCVSSLYTTKYSTFRVSHSNKDIRLVKNSTDLSSSLHQSDLLSAFFSTTAFAIALNYPPFSTSLHSDKKEEDDKEIVTTDEGLRINDLVISGYGDLENNILACSIIDRGQDRKQTSILRRTWNTVTKNLKVCSEFICDATFMIIRGGEILIRFSPLIILSPVAVLLASSSTVSQQNQRMSSIVSDVAWSYTLNTLEDLGPTFVKLGQWAGTRRDLFPDNVCHRLSQLHDRAYCGSRRTKLAYRWRLDRLPLYSRFFRTNQKEKSNYCKYDDDDHRIHLTLCEAFGKDYDKRLIVERNHELGGGAVACVYHGWLLDEESEENKDTEGRRDISKRKRKPVAVKILHKDIQKRMKSDLKFLDRLATLVSKCFSSDQFIYFFVYFVVHLRVWWNALLQLY